MSEGSSVPVSSGPAPLADTLTLQLHEQRQRVQNLQREVIDPEDALEESLLEISVAHEALRVAQDELRIQQKSIEDLLEQQRQHDVWRERVSSLLPLPVFVTDRAGTVIDANSVAAALLGVAEAGVLRKPLTSFVDDADRRQLRQVISQMADHPEQQLVITLKPRRGAAVQVTLAAFTDPGGDNGHRQYRWVAVPTRSLEPGDPVQPSDASAAVFATLCRLPLEGDEPRQLLARVAALGRIAVPHATGISVSLGSPIEPEAIATESEFAQAVDGAQFEAGEGPCVDAYNSGEVTRSPQMTLERRWPHFTPKARHVGLCSALAIPLQQGPQTIGVVSLYAHEEEAFDTGDVRTAGLFAAAVGAVVQDVRERESLRKLGVQLEEALQSRGEIDQAKGIIMARHGCSADEAFARLVMVSRNTNTKLADLSARLVRATVRPSPAARP
ncbi:MAG: ANTAR domain-containing protein [Geodermatophilaceae bacterium]|nr:ANTAR domain-containing protein [Geodermatophilaceae bacterium]